MGQTPYMKNVPVFHPWSVPLVGVELVMGSLPFSDAESSTVQEVRELGRDCARQAAAKLLNDPAGELTYSSSGAPLWTSGESQGHLSISHTGHIALGVAADTNVGIDIEFFDRDVRRLVKSFTSGEAAIAKQTSPIALLCAKEAAGKAAGVGLAGSLTRWHVFSFEVNKQSLLVRDRQTLEQWRVWIGVVEVEERLLQCAVARPAHFTRAELDDIYETTRVEMRPFGSERWHEGVGEVRKRALSGVVITAWNPGPDRPSLTENENANGLLLSRLREYCSDIWEADGLSPDGIHREPGFMAWGMQPDIGIRIAREFRQLAIFYFEASGKRVLLSA